MDKLPVTSWHKESSEDEKMVQEEVLHDVVPAAPNLKAYNKHNYNR